MAITYGGPLVHRLLSHHHQLQYFVNIEILPVVLALLIMLKFLKWFPCCRVDDSGESTPGAVCVEKTQSNRRFVLPRYWMDHDDSVKVTTLRIKLPYCKRETIKVRIWNRRQLQVLAASQFNCYKLQLQLPHGARSLDKPYFTPHDGVLTCRFRGPTLRCKSCGSTLLRDSIAEAKGASKSVSDLDLASMLETDPLLTSSLELVEPRYWITYGDNMALFEADLQGCKYSSQIKFHVANNRVVLYAYLSPLRRYALELRLESSAAKGGWKGGFHRDLQIFNCTIPLLGYYECGRCVAVREDDAVPDTEKNGNHTEKVVKVDLEKVVGLDGTADEEEDEEYAWCTDGSGSEVSSLDSDLMDFSDEDERFDSAKETFV